MTTETGTQNTIKILTLSALSVLLTALAQPNEFFNFGFPAAGMISLVPWFLACGEMKTWKSAALYGALFMALVSVFTNYWLYFFQDYALVTIGAVTAGYAVQGLVLGWYVRFARTRDSRISPLALALVWTGYEYLKATGFLGYPWGLCFYPFSEWHILNQVADITGIWGLSFLVSWFQALLAEVVSLSVEASGIRSVFNVIGKQITAFILITAAVTGYGVLRVNENLPVERTLDMLMIQQNIDSWQTEGGFKRRLADTQQLTEIALAEKPEKSPDCIVWSETSLSYPYLTYQSFYRREPEYKSFKSFLEETDSWFISGTPIQLSKNPPAYMNGIVLLDPQDRVQGKYGKQHLVPMAESIPFWELGIVRAFFQNVLGMTMPWSAGKDGTVLTLTRGDDAFKFAAPICYDDAFPDLHRVFAKNGADFFVVLTNDSWSKTNSAQIQHLVVSRYRTIESRRPMIRSTNSGYTCIIDGRGRITQSLPMFQKNWLRADLELPSENQPLTAYTIYGDWFAFLCMAGVLFLLIRHKIMERTDS